MIVLALLGVLLLSVYAYKTKKLTLSGAISAFVVGALISFGLGFKGLLLLAIFFFTSGFWSRFYQERKENEITAKGSTRDGWQVLANGGFAAICALLFSILQDPIYICGFVASLAAANADTWASEVGPLAKRRPIHIIKWKPVDAGTSGAVSAIGTAAAFAGSFIIVVVSIFFWWSSSFASHHLLFSLTLAGFLGNLFDTLVGATGQVLYQCPRCGLETERKIHCNGPTEKKYGLRFLNNDTVNAICTGTGALFGIVAGLILL
ncbi:TIGR00297 family protein [Halalkalibacterium halodurans]|jgi:uncharacterized protein (TIGR00297 family)|uniref:BH1418 protein n=1 Tax=Halalkalibacterium halodurans (strain ATCC BAA-125 / DSM 18197 / FERM 7344 / JCM 9153 / C-125) TaxID=272558 RepID=Q9KD01_HALH5|nr:TIGR00297 family protein [Halalkalibacterium halodurans]MDY7221942.1 TIGR00297 family protein [Halalkalibacterium halodurans]MDY7241218.1 TIGR00297 family protein [Halalkalibacterium halodurans]MED3647498.1 TIGR00297 family protein [Halalkalibacterium halodurans]MED4080729.1 TIGR00297 family protein [Halalkalibacterium halodurans]MED4087181.1 TIGR00297 family protein [Halalkalibacterium halodurans]